MLRVYIENQTNRAAAYWISEEIFRGAVPQSPSDYVVSIHDSDRPDLVALEQADVFVGTGFDVERLRQHGSKLKLVHCTSAGVERYLPLDWLPMGAKFTNSSGIHAQKAREYATMSLLMLNTLMPLFFASQVRRRWTPSLTPSIQNRNVLVVGLGRLGNAVASAAMALGLNVEGISKHGRSVDTCQRVYPVGALRERAQYCDFLVLCCPLTSESRGIVNADVIRSMKRGASIINMARGAVLVTDDLVCALNSGHLAGAILDVFETEPLPEDSALWSAPNLVVTPHISCDTPSGYTEKSMRILARNIARLRVGVKELENEVSAELGY